VFRKKEISFNVKARKTVINTGLCVFNILPAAGIYIWGLRNSEYRKFTLLLIVLLLACDIIFKKVEYMKKLMARDINLNRIIIILVVIVIIGLWINYGIISRDFYGELEDCAFYIRCVGESVFLYEVDYGCYPSSIEQVNAAYGDCIVVVFDGGPPYCPVCECPYGYIYNKEADKFTLWCSKPQAHVLTYPEVPLNGCWPQYSSHRGLMLKP